MKKAFILVSLVTIFLSCNEKASIIGEWKVVNWTGQSYSVFNLRPRAKTLFDTFAYALFNAKSRKLIFERNSSFVFKDDASKDIIGKFYYVQDSCLNLFAERDSLCFSILKETKDSVLLYAKDIRQIEVADLKLTIIR